MSGFGISLSAPACVMTGANMFSKGRYCTGLFFICMAVVFAFMATWKQS